MYRKLFIFLFTIASLQSKAQQPGDSNESSNVYEIYARQLRELLRDRGVPESDIKVMVESYKSSTISSDENFADLLSKLYPADKGIGILFYFFNKDSLRRVFFEPGKIIEKKTTFIKKDQLMQLSVDLNYVLGLKKMAANRTPVNRGIKVKEKPASPGITYASIITKATNLLLPSALGKQYTHLLIVPSLNIGTIPFQLLKPYNDDSLLIDRCSFSIVPGLLDLLTLRTKVLKNVANLWNGNVSIKFDMNPDFERLDGYAAFSLDNPLFVSNPSYPTNTDFYFPDLPGAKNEIDSAKQYAKKYKLLKGSEAVKDSVIEYMKHADVVYFATHGIADEEKPMEKSFLVLSGDDPFLTAKNIMDLRNNNYFEGKFPEMVILSACQTGLGKSMEAGIAGLARSFLLAGSNHVIMSLWNVNDNATAYLMNRFIYHLQENHLFMPSEPLRLAMLDTRKKFPEPSQWASFSMFGIDY